MKRSMFFRIGVCLFATILTLSCYFFESPTQSSVEPYIPPVTDVSPTNTPLPPLPEFEQLLSFGGAGGGGLSACPDFSTYTGPSPAVKGGLSFDSIGANSMAFQNLPRLAYLCLWGFPADKPFIVSLTSPDESHSLNAEFGVYEDSHGWQKLRWTGYENEFITVQGAADDLAVEIDFWWPGNTQSGIWKINVTWSGGSISGDFDADANGLAEIYLEDAGLQDQLLPLCRPVASQTGFHVVGENFPINSQAHILLYERNPSLREGNEKHFKLAWTGSVLVDGNGYFRSSLPYELKSGLIYQLIAVNDSSRSVTAQIYDQSFGAVDCFKAPFVPGASSCPGAPLQRMTVNQRGFVCTRNEAVLVRISPARSASTIVQIEPGLPFDVLGGPFCSDDWSWWNIQMPDGTTGWVSEGGDEIDPYFICPMP